ncbi:MAG: hypothetical protein IIC60_00670 [Proteobacteria bacterium]|nr:hypothetical protein [Pseudomonadota bacterium]
MTSLAQFDARYDPHEDRILLRITNTDEEEFRLWLTRRLTHSIITDLKTKSSAYRLRNAVSEDTLTAAEGEITRASSAPRASSAEAVIQAEFEQQATAGQLKFDSKFKPGESYPLGEAGLLVGKVNFKANANGPGSHALSFYPVKGAGITIGVSVEFLHSIFEILERVSKSAEWGFVSSSQLQNTATLQ